MDPNQGKNQLLEDWGGFQVENDGFFPRKFAEKCERTHDRAGLCWLTYV